MNLEFLSSALVRSTQADSRYKFYLYKRSIALILFFGFSATAHADLLAFCTGTPPTDTTLLAAFKAQCPAYLTSQFASAAVTSANTAATTQLSEQQTQQQIQSSIYSSLSGLIKPPQAQVSQGATVGSLTSPAQIREAELIYEIAQTIGGEIKDKIDSDHRALFISSSSALATIQSSPIQESEVLQGLKQYATNLNAQTCAPSAKAKAAILPFLLAAGAVASTAAAIANMFQPSLLATGNAAGVSDPQQLMIGGLISGLGEDKKAYLVLNTPPITPSNPVIGSLQDLRGAIAKAAATAANCKSSSDTQAMTAAITQAQQYITSITQISGTSPSIFDLAVLRAALDDQKIKYTLLLQRDVSSIGVAAVKPNWFTSTKLYMGAADLISYQLTELGGTVTIAKFEKNQWHGTCGLNKWADVSGDCSSGSEVTKK